MLSVLRADRSKPIGVAIIRIMSLCRGIIIVDSSVGTRKFLVLESVAKPQLLFDVVFTGALEAARQTRVPHSAVSAAEVEGRIRCDACR